MRDIRSWRDRINRYGNLSLGISPMKLIIIFVLIFTAGCSEPRHREATNRPLLLEFKYAKWVETLPSCEWPAQPPKGFDGCKDEGGVYYFGPVDIGDDYSGPSFLNVKPDPAKGE